MPSVSTCTTTAATSLRCEQMCEHRCEPRQQEGPRLSQARSLYWVPPPFSLVPMVLWHIA